ncbi:MAG: hypothetical protein WBR26_19430 [Candidatus Acidiferrum sp.]
MFLRFAIPLSLLLYASGDVPDLPHVSPTSSSTQSKADAFTPEDRIPLYPAVISAEPQDQSKPSQSPAKKNDTLQEMSKLQLIRYVSGEFAKAKKPLPGGKDGFVLYANKPVDEQNLSRAVSAHGIAVNTGDNAQITKLEFREHEIIVDVNGGGRPRKNWRDHLQLGMGGTMPTTTTTTTNPNGDQGPPGFQQGRGGTIYLQFAKNIPDLTPEELKELLAPFLDFSKEKSASVNWIDTLPPEMKKAITDRHPVVGMDRDEVVAAIGKPDRKVRERDSQGNDTEDWIYGHPPDRTVFVHFTGDRVTTIKQYPQ